MLKKFIYITIVFSLIVLSACRDENVTYAEELKAERETIERFLARNNYQVVTVRPTEFPWPDNVIFRTASGMYFRLTDQGDISNPADSLMPGDKVVPRFIQYTLTDRADTVFNWNTIDFPYTSTFNYRDLTQVSPGWHEAAGLMKYNDAEAMFIVPSKLGFSQFSRPATPVGYDMKIRINKFR